MQTTNANLMADVIENIKLILQLQSLFSIHLVLHRLYRWITSLLSQMLCISLNVIYNVYPAWLFSVHCVQEVGLKIEFRFYGFDDFRKKLVSGHYMSNLLTVMSENHKRYIFRILPVNVPSFYVTEKCNSWIFVYHWRILCSLSMLKSFKMILNSMAFFK